MNLYEIAQHFYARSQSARTSSHWEHLNQFGPEMFENPDWLDNFLSRWVSVGFNDTTMGIPDRFSRKQRTPLEMIQLDRNCMEFDVQKSQAVMSILRGHFPGIDFTAWLGHPTGTPVQPILLETDDGRKIGSSFHELSLLYMGLRLQALTQAADLSYPLRVLEIGGGYGGLFEKLVRLMRGQIDTVYLVDLPFNLSIQYWFVQALRESGVHELNLVTDLSSLPPSDSRAGFVVFVPVDDLEQIGELDVVINARSFGEMLPEDVTRYIRLIESRIRHGGLFYNMNRYQKKNSADDVLCLKSYPYDACWSVLNHQLVFFFHGIGELALLRSREPDPMLRKALAALPLYLPVTGRST